MSKIIKINSKLLESTGKYIFGNNKWMPFLKHRKHKNDVIKVTTIVGILFKHKSDISHWKMITEKAYIEQTMLNIIRANN